jgi:hypothetical protein
MVRYEEELKLVEARAAELKAKIAEAEAAKAGASRPLLALAVQLHTSLCWKDHAAHECSWYSQGAPDDIDMVDWGEPGHAFWLKITQSGIAIARELGFTIEEPS